MSPTRILGTALLACAGASVAVAQEPIVVAKTGDVVPGVGTVQNIGDAAVDNDGNVIVRVITDNPDPLRTNAYVDGDGNLLLYQGQVLDDPPGSVLRSLYEMRFNDAGTPVFLFAMDDDYHRGIFTGLPLHLELLEGDPCTAPSAPPGATFADMLTPEINDAGEIAFYAVLDDPSLPGLYDKDIVVVISTTTGAQRIVAAEGDILPGQTDVNTGFQWGKFGFNDAGQVIYVAVPASLFSPVIYLDDEILAACHTLGPQGVVIGSIHSVELNDAGDYTYSVNSNGDEVFFRNQVPILHAGESGDVVPGIEPYDIGSAGLFATANDGRMLWAGSWDTPVGTGAGAGVFADFNLLVEKGVTSVDGLLVEFAGHYPELSPNGRYAIFGVDLEGGNHAALLIDLWAEEGLRPDIAPVPDVTERAELRASDAAEKDIYGEAVATNGSTILVGCRNDDDFAGNSGSVYVYERVGGSWNEVDDLHASDGAGGDGFGIAVAMSEDTALIGAAGDDHASHNAGSAYVFVRENGVWTEQAKLVASDPGPLDRFGVVLALSGDRAVVGVPQDDDFGDQSGSCHVYVRNGTTWSHEAKLLAPDGAADDAFGRSVAIDGDTIVVGAYNDDDTVRDSGSAHVFVHDGSSWTHQAKLVASDPEFNDGFGRSVAVQGDELVVGAFLDDAIGVDSGAVYVFDRDGATWTEVAKLTATDADAVDSFGYTVALDRDVLVVGGYGENDAGVATGSAYSFLKQGGVWTAVERMIPDERESSDLFGAAVAVSRGTIVIGALWDDDDGLNSGSAHVYPTPWARARPVDPPPKHLAPR